MVVQNIADSIAYAEHWITEGQKGIEHSLCQNLWLINRNTEVYVIYNEQVEQNVIQKKYINIEFKQEWEINL